VLYGGFGPKHGMFRIEDLTLPTTTLYDPPVAADIDLPGG